MNPKLKRIMNDWRSLNEHLHKLSEAEVKEMLDWEKTNTQRKVFLERLHQRYGVLRASRERAAL